MTAFGTQLGQGLRQGCLDKWQEEAKCCQRAIHAPQFAQCNRFML